MDWALARRAGARYPNLAVNKLGRDPKVGGKRLQELGDDELAGVAIGPVDSGLLLHYLLATDLFVSRLRYKSVACQHWLV